MEVTMSSVSSSTSGDSNALYHGMTVTGNKVNSQDAYAYLMEKLAEIDPNKPANNNSSTNANNTSGTSNTTNNTTTNATTSTSLTSAARAANYGGYI